MPSSLYAQLLLAVALALLVAQVINGALLFSALKNRSEAEAATLAIGSVIARDGIAGIKRTVEGQRKEARPDRRSPIYKISRQPIGGKHFPINRELSARAAGFLALPTTGQEAPVIAVGPIAALPNELRRQISGRPIFRRLLRQGRLPPEHVLILSIHQADGNWINALTILRPMERSAVINIILQTLLLYLLVLAALAFVARRISRPLARLKEGMANFGGNGKAAAIEETGPSDIRELVAVYNGMQQRLDVLLSEKDVMLGAIGHDLKTPLSSLRVRVESVEDDGERDQMVASIDEMTAILDDILTLARMGKSGELVQLTDINALIETILDDFVAQEGQLVFHPPGTSISANIRPMLLRRALRNLIGNALRYGGNAEIRVDRKDHLVAVTILDNGPGIVGADIEAMFEPFARAEASRNKASGGTGLGLTIARAIARAHGGDVILSNRAEGGLAAELTMVC